MLKVAEKPPLIYRHTFVVRTTHWINVLCLALLLMSGLQIFNAHSALYWGAAADFPSPLLAMGADPDNDAKGVTTLFGHKFDTTGWLGVTVDAEGDPTERGFPAWITLPGPQDLAAGRRWHFFFAWLLVANGLLYLVHGLLSGHVRADLAPTRADLRHIPRSILDHARLRFPKGDAARRYNALQKLTYLAVIFILLPVMIAAGLAMSPGLDARFPQLLTLFGGRQSARTVHFILAWGLVLFALVHVVMVVLSGFFNNMRSMITGRYNLGREKHGA